MLRIADNLLAAEGFKLLTDILALQRFLWVARGMGAKLLEEKAVWQWDKGGWYFRGFFNSDLLLSPFAAGGFFARTDEKRGTPIPS